MDHIDTIYHRFLISPTINQALNLSFLLITSSVVYLRSVFEVQDQYILDHSYVQTQSRIFLYLTISPEDSLKSIVNKEVMNEHT